MRKKILFILILFSLNVSTLYSSPPAWEPIQGTEYSMVVLGEIYLYDKPFTADSDNIAAAFGPGGETDCRSIAVWQPANPPYWDGYWYFTIVGNTNGENIHFKIYDSATDTIYHCNQELAFQDGETEGTPESPFSITAAMGSIVGNVALITNTPPAGNIQDVEVSAGITSTTPDTDGNYQLMLPPGVYDIVITLTGYTSITLYDIIAEENQVTDSIDVTLIDWEQITGTQYSMVVMGTVDINGNELAGMSNNLIAAFGPGGNDDCRAIGIWEEANPPYWDGYWYLNITGDINDEEIHFQIFDEQTSIIYDCIQKINFQNNETIGSPDTPFQFSVGHEQVFQLNENWNWISFNTYPENSSLDSVFSQLGPFIYQIKNQTESATYYDPPGSWVGNLTNITDGSAYLVNMHEEVDSFSVSGMPIDAITPIQLSENWNWIAYYPQVPLHITDALKSIEGKAYQIKNQTESATYYNPPGIWVGNLDFMEPNIGYKLKMDEPAELVYPQPSDKRVPNKGINRLNLPNWQIIPGTQYSMILMAQITFNGEAFEGELNQNMTGAFGPGGETDCRSLAAWQEDFPPYWDGYWYFTIVGNDNGENISFMIYDNETDSVYSCIETLVFQDNTTIGEPSNPYQLTAGQTSVDQHNNDELCVSVYPNPFTESVAFNLSSLRNKGFSLSIYDLRGRVIQRFNKNNISDNQIIRWNTKDMNGESIKPGLYLYQLSGKNISKKGKIIYLSK